MINVQLARQVSMCTRFCAITATVRTLEKQVGVMQSQEEHRKEVESISNRTLTRTDRKDLATETTKAAITDNAAKENHVIDWSGAKILDSKGHRRTRQLKESIRIREEANCGVFGLKIMEKLVILCRC